MKKIVALISSLAVVFSLGMSTALGASGGGGGGGTQAPTCDVTNTCKVYVNDVMISAETGTTSEPFRSITAAVNFVKNNADYNTIRIAGGNYGPQDSPGGETFPLTVSTLGRPLNIQGGYSENFSTLDPAAYPTVVDADGHNFLELTTTGGSFRGLTVMKADVALDVNNSNSGAGNLMVEDNIFSENEEVMALSVQGTNSATVRNNMFTDNLDLNNSITAYFNGGTDNMAIYNNVFSGNTADEDIFYCEDALAYNNFFFKNDTMKVASVEVLAPSITILLPTMQLLRLLQQSEIITPS